MSNLGSPRRPGAAARGTADLVRVWQNFYRDGQDAELDPAFLANDGRRNARTDYRELGLFIRMYHAGQHLQARYTGIVSPKFGEKTGLPGEAFLRFVADHPGHDVYFVNPFPQNAYCSFNVWTHGDDCHPGLTLLAQNLFDRAGIDFNIAAMGRNASDTLLYSNVWVGNQRFWDRFMHLNLALLRALDGMDEIERTAYFELDPSYHDPVPVLPFIFERLFSTLLHMDRSISALAYPHSRSEILRAASASPVEYRLVLAFKHVVDEVDQRGVYDARDQELFRAITQFKRIQNVQPRHEMALVGRSSRVG